MHPSGRPNLGRRRPSGLPAGFPDFSDPFPGLGMFGGSGFFDDFFSRNPFDDPFFTRPFGSMFGSTGGLFGPSGFMGHGGLLESGGFFGRPGENLLDQRPALPHQPEGRRGPVIEELPDDHETLENNSPQDQQPIVEHPDDDVGSAGTTTQARNQQLHTQSFQSPSNSGYQSNSGYRPNSGYQSNRGYQSFSYQSSSMTYGGTGGSYYSSSSTKRVGSDGVMEEKHTERDSSGYRTDATARGLHGKVHAIAKKRTATGPESTLETLHNLTPEESAQFDANWEVQAERSLPSWNRGRSQMLEGIEGTGTRSTPRPVLALPYNEGSRDGSQPPKKQIRI